MTWTRDRFATVVFCAALVIGAGLRLPMLDEAPNGFYADEASAGYDAYSMLRTGRDQYGSFLPTFARSFGDYDEASYRYLTVPTVAVLGRTVAAVRLPAALAGLATIAVLYLLISRWWNPRAGALAALALAISPWHVLFSRIAFRGILLPLGIGAALVLASQAQTRPRRWIAFGIAAALALWTYSPARVIVPALVLVVVALELPRIEKRALVPFLVGLTIFAACLSSLALFWISPEGMARAEHALRDGTFSTFRHSYASYFGAAFLFESGDPNPRHSFADFAQLHWFEVLTVPLGIVAAAARRRREDFVLAAWLLLAPIPAALTVDAHALRDIAAVPAFAALSGVGMHTILDRFHRARDRKLAIGWLAALVVYAASTLGEELYRDYRGQVTGEWQWGMRELVEEMSAADAPCRVVSNRFFLPHVFIAFFAPIEPREYQASPVSSITQGSFTIDDWQLGDWRVAPLERAIEERPECVFGVSQADAASFADDPRYREIASSSDPLRRVGIVVFRMDVEPAAPPPRVIEGTQE